VPNNTMSSFVIFAKKGKDMIGGTTQIYYRDDVKDAIKIAIEEAKERWPESDGWTGHAAKELHYEKGMSPFD